MGKCKLRIDCAKLSPAAIEKLLSKLRLFVEPVLVGGDLIYVEERIHHDNYASVWKILEHFNVKVD